MKKSFISLMAIAIPALASAQSAMDALQVSQPDFKGTARFMSMGGAFTALGGDLTVLGQNPAGIGIYRSSEVGVTLDIDFQSTKTDPASQLYGNSMSQTKAYCNNFGYVGSTRLDGAMRTFNWGVSFTRIASFDRVFTGYSNPSGNSLTNYIAAFSDGITASDMDFGTGYDPYLDTNIDWLSILAYNSYMISPTGNNMLGGNTYSGLYKNNTVGDALSTIREQGGIDEYNISFGGNVEDVVYWGISFGITDLTYKRYALYSESMSNALVPADRDATTLVNGSAYFNLDNFKYINGSGWNIKAGVILKPTQEFRIGLAIHTPTWYKLTQGYDAQVDYTYTPTDLNGMQNGTTITSGNSPEYSDEAYFDWRLSAPWRLMAGVAGVIGGKAIISLDYEYDAYSSMRVSTPMYDYYGYINGYVTNDEINNNITNTYRGSSTLRLGLEYRVTKQFSVRAGYNYTNSNAKKEALDGQMEIVTAGTDPSFSLDRHIQNFCAGVGYRYQAWYIDAAFVYKQRESVYRPYTCWAGNTSPSLKLTDGNAQIVLSTGFKF